MSLMSQTDRQALVEALGEPFTWKGQRFFGVLELPFENVLGITSSSISLTVEQAAIDAGLITGDTVTRVSDAAAYTVRAQEPDGEGLIRLVLEAQ